MNTPDENTIRVNNIPPINVKVQEGDGTQRELQFIGTFKIGRDKSCHLQLKDKSVSRFHAEVSYDGESWWVRDLDSVNGTYLDGVRIKESRLTGESRLELGTGGLVILLSIEDKKEDLKETEISSKSAADRQDSVTQVMDRYFGKNPSEQAGQHTIMIRQAFERVQKKQSNKYLIIIGFVVLLLVISGGVVVYQQVKLRNLKTLAQDIFYNMKEIELQVAVMENMVIATADPLQRAELTSKRNKIKELEKSYDRFLEEMGVYSKGMNEEERTILRVARLLGECEVNVPKGFVKEVQNYIRKWHSSDRLKNALHRAEMGGYGHEIAKEMAVFHLPSQFFYLALQESGFDDRAVGPPTKYGIAKGVWQFIPATAVQYGLKTGPLLEDAKYDPRDERHDFIKSTQAAAKYLNDIYNTEAQASGLLVFASYNWGENNVRSLINQMPKNPRDRNFWKLLERYKVPQETYDYVYYIFSAAVIGENPRLFGFDFVKPIPQSNL